MLSNEAESKELSVRRERCSDEAAKASGKLFSALLSHPRAFIDHFDAANFLASCNDRTNSRTVKCLLDRTMRARKVGERRRAPAAGAAMAICHGFVPP